MVTTAGEATPPTQAKSLMLDHLGLMTSLLLALFVPMKLLFVARFNLPTALVLAQRSDSAAIIIGTLTTSLDFIFVVLVIALLVIHDNESLSDTDKQLIRFLLVLLVPGLLVLTPLVGLSILLLTDLLLDGPVSRWSKQRNLNRARAGKKSTWIAEDNIKDEKAKAAIHALIAKRDAAITEEERQKLNQEIGDAAIEGLKASEEFLAKLDHVRYRSRKIFFVATSLVVLVVLAQALSSRRPWFPHEVITEKSRYVGFVVEESEESVTILREADRRVLRLPNSAIKKRELCRIAPETFDKWFYISLVRGSSYPICPDSPAEAAEGGKSLH